MKGKLIRKIKFRFSVYAFHDLPLCSSTFADTFCQKVCGGLSSLQGERFQFSARLEVLV
jgi:hypothetical protein